MMQKIFEVLEHQPRAIVLGLGLGLAVLIGVVDRLIHQDISLAIFYLLPVALSTWFINYRVGLAMSFFCTLAWLQADVAAKDYASPLMPYWNGAVRFGFFIIVAHLLTALRAAYQREQELARIDSLTGVSNRRFFLELLQINLDQARRYTYPLTLAYLDVDDFKVVNDQSGHLAGDRLLQQVAQVLQKAMRSCDTIARLGGDEFAILLPQTDFSAAKAALHRTHQYLHDLQQAHHWPVGFSIGAITFVTLPDTAEAMVNQADQLMYTVKRSGKDRLECRQYKV